MTAVRKTAEELQKEGVEAAKRGECVYFLYPLQVWMCVETQTPHIVMGPIPLSPNG